MELSDFEKANDRILGGLEKKHSAMTQHEKRLVAYHEVLFPSILRCVRVQIPHESFVLVTGRARRGWLVPGARRPAAQGQCNVVAYVVAERTLCWLSQVTIVPRGKGMLGFAQYLPKELSLYQQEQVSCRDVLSVLAINADAHVCS